MTDKAIQVNGVWKRFRKGEFEDSLRELVPNLLKRCIGRSPSRRVTEFWALQDVSFEIERGQSLGIIGPNGAGKSTMLKLLSRIIRPNRGTYQINGRLSALIEVGAGFHQDLTGRENIYLNGAILGMTRRDIKAKEEAIIDFADVEEFIHTPVKRYSSGMRARLGFAIAAHMDPEILLVDEVLSVGDARFRDKCVRHMHKLLRSGITVVFISHILDQVRSLCPQTMVLNHGKNVFLGKTDDAIRKYLEVLDTAEAAHQAAHGGNKPAVASAAEIRNVRFCDVEGREVLEWRGGEPGIVECDLTLRQPVGNPTVQINFTTVSGLYLTTADARYMGYPLPDEPGTHRVRFTFDPMPLPAGDYSLEFKVYGGDDNECVWAMPQPRLLSVRGCDANGVVLCQGRWEVLEPVAAQHDGERR